MESTFTEIAVILDESGSMTSCRESTIKGFNEFLNTQKMVKGNANLTLVKFSDYYKVVYDSVPLEKVSELNIENYTPSNSTALLDAVGKTINLIDNKASNRLLEEEEPRVIMLILTDGEENASIEFTKDKINKMVNDHKGKWEFIFIGADINAWGQDIGIYSNVSINKADMEQSFVAMSYCTANYRTGNAVSTNDFNMSVADLNSSLSYYYDADKVKKAKSKTKNK
jgi:uncharacterized protein YegL